MLKRPDLTPDLKEPITSQILPMPPSLVFPSQGLVRVTRTLQGKGSIPSCSNYGKNPAEFSHASPCAAAVTFISIYPSRLWVGGTRKKNNRAFLLGSHLHRSSHKHHSIPIHLVSLNGRNGMTHTRPGRYLHVQDCRKREREEFFSAKNLPKLKNKQTKHSSAQSIGICLCIHIFADSSRNYSNYVSALKTWC